MSNIDKNLAAKTLEIRYLLKVIRANGFLCLFACGKRVSVKYL